MYNVWAAKQALASLARKIGKKECRMGFHLFLDLIPPRGLLNGLGLQRSPVRQIVRAAPQIDAVEFDKPAIWVVLVEAKEN